MLPHEARNSQTGGARENEKGRPSRDGRPLRLTPTSLITPAPCQSAMPAVFIRTTRQPSGSANVTPRAAQ